MPSSLSRDNLTAGINAAIASSSASQLHQLLSQIPTTSFHPDRELLLQLLDCFANLEKPTRFRRWCGLLLGEIVRCSEPSAKLLFEGPHALEGLASIVKRDGVVLKIVSGLVIRALCQNGMDPLMLWNVMEQPSANAEFPMSESEEWILEFGELLYEMNEAAGTESKLDFGVFHGIDVSADNDVRFSEAPGMAVLMAEPDNVVIIVEETASHSFQFIDIPHDCIRSVGLSQSTLDAVFQPDSAVVHEVSFNLLEQREWTYMLNTSPEHALSIRVYFEDKDDAHDAAKKIQEMLPIQISTRPSIRVASSQTLDVSARGPICPPISKISTKAKAEDSPAHSLPHIRRKPKRTEAGPARASEEISVYDIPLDSDEEYEEDPGSTSKEQAFIRRSSPRSVKTKLKPMAKKAIAQKAKMKASPKISKNKRSPSRITAEPVNPGFASLVENDLVRKTSLIHLDNTVPESFLTSSPMISNLDRRLDPLSEEECDESGEKLPEPQEAGKGPRKSSFKVYADEKIMEMRKKKGNFLAFHSTMQKQLGEIPEAFPAYQEPIDVPMLENAHLQPNSNKRTVRILRPISPNAANTPQTESTDSQQGKAFLKRNRTLTDVVNNSSIPKRRSAPVLVDSKGSPVAIIQSTTHPDGVDGVSGQYVILGPREKRNTEAPEVRRARIRGSVDGMYPEGAVPVELLARNLKSRPQIPGAASGSSVSYVTEQEIREALHGQTEVRSPFVRGEKHAKAPPSSFLLMLRKRTAKPLFSGAATIQSVSDADPVSENEEPWDNQEEEVLVELEDDPQLPRHARASIASTDTDSVNEGDQSLSDQDGSVTSEAVEEVEEMDWDASFQPELRDMKEALFAASRRLLIHLSTTAPAAVSAIATAYRADCQALAEDVTKHHEEEHRILYQGLDHAQKTLVGRLRDAAENIETLKGGGRGVSRVGFSLLETWRAEDNDTGRRIEDIERNIASFEGHDEAIQGEAAVT